MLGLAGYIADRLVEQYRHALLLGILCGGAQLYLLVGVDLAAQFADDLAVDFDPALFDVVIRFAAGAQAEFRHAFGQAYFFHENLAWTVMQGAI